LIAALLLPVLLFAVLFLPLAAQIVIPLVLLVGLTWIASPETTLIVVVGARMSVDLLYNVPGIAGLNLMETYSGSTAVFIAMLCIMHGRHLTRHPYFLPFLIFMPLSMFSALREGDVRFALSAFTKSINPMLVMFVVSIIMRFAWQRKAMLWSLTLCGIIPIVNSWYHWWTGQMNSFFLDGFYRLLGGYHDLHGHAHAMAAFIMLALICLYNAKKPWVQAFLVLYLLAAGTVLYLTYVRTTTVGLAVFALVFLLVERKFLTVGLLLLGMAVVFALEPNLQARFDDVVVLFSGSEEQVKEVGSGRVGLWTTSWTAFITEHNAFNWFFGVSSGGSFRMGVEKSVHNDYLALLYNYGAIGLSLYLLFQYKVLQWGMWLSRRARDPWSRSYGSFIVAFSAMATITNVLSNSYVQRQTQATLFWCLAGIAYATMRSERRGIRADITEKKRAMQEGEAAFLPAHPRPSPR
jgi:hypothetical protein